MSEFIIQKVAYISGPITDIENNNCERFYEIFQKFKNMGYEVLNPLRHGVGKSHEEYMKLDIADLARADVMVLMQDKPWDKSRGVRGEIFCAAELFKVPIIDADTMEPVEFITQLHLIPSQQTKK